MLEDLHILPSLKMVCVRHLTKINSLLRAGDEPKLRRTKFWKWEAHRVGLKILACFGAPPALILVHTSVGGALAALISVKLALSIQRNEGTRHKHIILLDSKSKFYKSTLLEILAKHPRRKEKKVKEVKRVKNRICVCVCGGRWLLMRTRRKGRKGPLWKKTG